MSSVRVLLAAAGALTAGSVTWILWGLFTPGDYFAGGSPAVWVTLAGAGFAGALAAGRVRSRWAAALLLASALLFSAFWIVVPDGWWASSPPPTPSAE
jgi:hypothetical protein